jgi:hypothetical protein
MKMRIKQRFCDSAEARRPKPVQPVRLSPQIAAGLLLVAYGAGIFPACAVEPSPIIRVHVFNYSKATPSTVAQAEREALRILQGTGLNLDWLNCPVGQPAVNPAGSCRKLLSQTDILVRVLSDQTRNGITGDAYGFTVPPALASAYYDQAVRLATIDGAGYEVPLILGYVIAHEIGHLLLGAGSHSAFGIMQGHWERKQIQLLMRGRLGFTAQQSKLMRSEAYRRLMLETTQAVPTVPQGPMKIGVENAGSATTATSETLPWTTASVTASKDHLEAKNNLEPIGTSLVVMDTADAPGTVDSLRLTASLELTAAEFNVNVHELPSIVVFHLSKAAAANLGLTVSSTVCSTGSTTRYELWIIGEPSDLTYSFMAENILEDHFKLKVEDSERARILQTVGSRLNMTVDAKAFRKKGK